MERLIVWSVWRNWGKKHQFFKRYSYGGIGQLAIPIPAVGAFIGGFVDAMLSEAFFNALNSKKVEPACQKRIEIEKECRESITGS